jgi:serine protease Do
VQARWISKIVAFAIIGLATISSTGNLAHAQSDEATLDRRLPSSQTDIKMSLSPLVKQTAPAVVNIYTKKVVEQRQRTPFFNDPFFKQFFGDRFGGAFGAPRQRVERSLGSGVIVSGNGTVVTNHHVIDGASEIRVVLHDNREFDADLVGSDERTDLAVLKLRGVDNELPAIPFGDSDAVEVGDLVLAIGNPFGVGQTVTSGIVSALARAGVTGQDYQSFIQTDAAINPGNSGGALVNMNGEMVGINTAIMSRSGGSQGVGFSIPSNMASRIMGMLIEHGEVQRAWLGVIPVEVDQTMAEALGMDETRGVLMSEVRPDTPAEEAGLKEGDIVLEVDGNAVNSTSTLRNTISLAGVGSDVKLRVLRDGRGRDITVTLGKLPDVPTVAGAQNEERENEEGIEGVTVRELNDRARTRLNIDEDVEGVIVTEVTRVSNAWNRGLRQGDIITEVAREEVKNLDDYAELVGRNPDRPVLLKILRGANVQLLAIPR